MTVNKSGSYSSLKECQSAVGTGWADIVKQCFDLCEEDDDDVYIMDVKEKYGGLRFYILGGADDLYDRIIDIERESLKICEICGRSGKPTDYGWIKTLCDEHMTEVLKP